MYSAKAQATKQRTQPHASIARLCTTSVPFSSHIKDPLSYEVRGRGFLMDGVVHFQCTSMHKRAMALQMTPLSGLHPSLTLHQPSSRNTSPFSVHAIGLK
jgi:hypothetical protein